MYTTFYDDDDDDDEDDTEKNNIQHTWLCISFIVALLSFLQNHKWLHKFEKQIRWNVEHWQ